ncbi:hypothetical protein F971_00849 [Acinetobacter vivianii]|uniref:Uncharacterized protein n=1 Tax=Acinetobacter vivianii TaxID=1776742 RepID=N8V1A0_9GAMM|nr:hypothetical protein [Acinetobacter vivianii]ENU93591.1 hypothetical protein F971_00849 [Acinetobacter vivianii]
MSESTNVTENNLSNSEKLVNEIQSVKLHLGNFIDSIGENNPQDVVISADMGRRRISDILKGFNNRKIPKYIAIIENNSHFFENDEFAEILWNEINSLRSKIFQRSNNKIDYIYDGVLTFVEKFENIKLSLISLQNANNLIEGELQSSINEVKEKIKDFDSVRLALEHRETSSIYLELHNKYNEEYESNNLYFYSVLGLSVFFTILSILITASFKSIDWILFVSSKVLILAVGITLCTLFLRRAAHAKKLKEQAYQTHVEINAFPIHVRSLKDEDKHELIKELALKYFGKELDQTQNDKIGDLMQDQLSAGTELIKASAELVKSVKPSGGNTDSGNDAVK